MTNVVTPRAIAYGTVERGTSGLVLVASTKRVSSRAASSARVPSKRGRLMPPAAVRDPPRKVATLGRARA